MHRPRIAITMGDPAGIGPEIILKTLQHHVEHLDAELLVVGASSCIQDAARQLGFKICIQPEAEEPWPSVTVVDAAQANSPIRPGVLSAEAGRLAFSAIETAAKLALENKVDAVVTAPINKEALHRAGYHYAGHTEILADLTGSPDSCMLLVHDKLRVAHVTTHTALSNVPILVTPHRLRRVITLAHNALQQLGVDQPRVAVAALNPHAGEDGLFGIEDQTVIKPVVEEFTRKRMKIEGPISGDIVFVKAYAGQYDLVIAMYHDQGHIPIKLLGFAVDPQSGRWTSLSGVNVTLGLPIIRTSVDHGTAFDIAGKGIANEQSLVEAIELAINLASVKSIGQGTQV